MKTAILALLAASLILAQNRPKVDKATVDKWMKELSNWGRWGKADQLGAPNLITPEKRKQAAALVRAGVTVSLAHDTEKATAADNPDPFSHEFTATAANPVAGQYSVDRYGVLYHGWAHSHMDALCHMFYEGKMYNGFSMNEITKAGAAKLAVTNLKNGIFTRAILMDIPRLKGVEWLEPSTAIYPEDLDAWEKKAGVRVQPGDIVLIRTGRWARRAAKGPWPIMNAAAGLHASCARWLRQRDIAILGSDGASDVMPSGVPGVAQPIHQLTLIAMGVPIFDNMDLEAAGKEAAKQSRWEFLVSAGPLPVPGGTGSPLNPIAVF
ncbi:MAG: cyclase family protein [Acidobacteria bacterium]|nr:cyclase family protein [Acidobacteriota bacterium]